MCSFSDLVDIQKVSPRILLDIRYATEDNFTHRVLYEEPLCFVHKDVAQKLSLLQTELEGQGLGLKIFDGYRPLSVQRKFWQILPDERYIAHPEKSPRHCRGTAVDLTLVNQEGKELHMPTAFDDFTEKAHRDCHDVPLEARVNRAFLTTCMERYGFIPFAYEWWHFDYAGYENYPILDWSFADLKKGQQES